MTNILRGRVNIFDIGAVSVQADMYQGWVMSDLFPEEPQPVLKNWHPEDLAAYCGGVYTVTRSTN